MGAKPQFVSLSPAKMFRANETNASDFRKFARSDCFQSAAASALSEFAQIAPTQEQLKGVQIFLHILLNIAEPEVELSQFPDRLKDWRKTLQPPEKKPSEKSKNQPAK